MTHIVGIHGMHASMTLHWRTAGQPSRLGRLLMSFKAEKFRGGGSLRDFLSWADGKPYANREPAPNRQVKRAIKDE